MDSHLTTRIFDEVERESTHVYKRFFNKKEVIRVLTTLYLVLTDYCSKLLIIVTVLSTNPYHYGANTVGSRITN